MSEWEVSVPERGGIRHRKLKIRFSSYALHCTPKEREEGRERGEGNLSFFLAGWLSVCLRGEVEVEANQQRANGESSKQPSYERSERAGAA